MQYEQYILGDCNLDGVLDNSDVTECVGIANCSIPVDWHGGCDDGNPNQWQIIDFTIQACACDVTGNDGMSMSDASRISTCESDNGSCQSRSSGTCQDLSSFDGCTIGEVCDWCPDGETCEYEECEDPLACNLGVNAECIYPEENYDCDGNCTAEVDCAGECGGSAVADECGVCNGPGADVACWNGSYECDSADCPTCDDGAACNTGVIAECTYADENYDCEGNCIAEIDCAGECNGSAVEDECGVCGGDGSIYECGCDDIPENDCDCDGNVLDECGICGGPGAKNVECWDGSMVCDAADCSDEPIPCSQEGACNYGEEGDCYFCDGTTSCNLEVDCATDFCTGVTSQYLWLGADNGGICLDVGSAGICQNGGGVTPYLGHECGDGACDSENLCCDPCPADEYCCAGVCGGDAVEDECGVCGGSGPEYECWDDSYECDSADCPTCENEAACNTGDEAYCEYAEDNYDCEGNCIAEIDCADECGGSAVEDCIGVCLGDKIFCEADGQCCTPENCDMCGNCAGGCNGGPNGPGQCNNGIYDCDGICVVEEDCAGVCFGDSVNDECGECNGPGVDENTCCPGDSQSCLGGSVPPEQCGIDIGCGCGIEAEPMPCQQCFNDSWNFEDDIVPVYGWCLEVTECVYIDDCGICGGFSSTCDDCNDPDAINYDPDSDNDAGCIYICTNSVVGCIGTQDTDPEDCPVCDAGELPLWGNCHDLPPEHTDGCMYSGCYSISETTYLNVGTAFGDGASSMLPEPLSYYYGNSAIIHPNIVYLENLQELNMSESGIVGEIPSTIGQLTNLIKFSAMDNELSGEIPASITEMVSLVRLSLTRNNLTGTLPTSGWADLPLEKLQLGAQGGYNRTEGFHGNIPEEIGQINNLFYLQLSYNQFTGELSSFGGNYLRYLHLEYNYLEGEFPSISSTVLLKINAGVNEFSGTIGKITQINDPNNNIEYLNFRNNNFTAVDNNLCKIITEGVDIGNLTSFTITNNDICLRGKNDLDTTGMPNGIYDIDGSCFIESEVGSTSCILVTDEVASYIPCEAQCNCYTQVANTGEQNCSACHDDEACNVNEFCNDSCEYEGTSTAAHGLDLSYCNQCNPEDDGSCAYTHTTVCSEFPNYEIPENYDCDCNCTATNPDDEVDSPDCEGVCGGDIATDACDICGGDNCIGDYWSCTHEFDCSISFCIDNNIGMNNECTSGGAGCTLINYDLCTSFDSGEYEECIEWGEGDGQNGNEDACCTDCNGDCWGDAIRDNCGVCSEGNSDHIPDSDIDCSGVCFGEAFFDNCWICSEGGSGHGAESDMDDCGVCFGSGLESDTELISGTTKYECINGGQTGDVCSCGDLTGYPPAEQSGGGSPFYCDECNICGGYDLYRPEYTTDVTLLYEFSEGVLERFNFPLLLNDYNISTIFGSNIDNISVLFMGEAYGCMNLQNHEEADNSELYDGIECDMWTQNLGGANPELIECAPNSHCFKKNYWFGSSHLWDAYDTSTGGTISQIDPHQGLWAYFSSFVSISVTGKSANLNYVLSREDSLGQTDTINTFCDDNIEGGICVDTPANDNQLDCNSFPTPGSCGVGGILCEWMPYCDGEDNEVNIFQQQISYPGPMNVQLHDAFPPEICAHIQGLSYNSQSAINTGFPGGCNFSGSIVRFHGFLEESGHQKTIIIHWGGDGEETFPFQFQIDDQFPNTHCSCERMDDPQWWDGLPYIQCPDGQFVCDYSDCPNPCYFDSPDVNTYNVNCYTYQDCLYDYDPIYDHNDSWPQNDPAYCDSLEEEGVCLGNPQNVAFVGPGDAPFQTPHYCDGGTYNCNSDSDCPGWVCESGVVDPCGVCDGNGEIQECGCGSPGEFGIPEGECCLEINEFGQCIGAGDCYGNIPDECGLCGGSCFTLECIDENACNNGSDSDCIYSTMCSNLWECNLTLDLQYIQPYPLVEVKQVKVYLGVGGVTGDTTANEYCNILRLGSCIGVWWMGTGLACVTGYGSEDEYPLGNGNAHNPEDIGQLTADWCEKSLDTLRFGSWETVWLQCNENPAGPCTYCNSNNPWNDLPDNSDACDSCADCFGIANGTSSMNCLPDNGYECDSGLVEDYCGVCGGDGSTCDGGCSDDGEQDWSPQPGQESCNFNNTQDDCSDVPDGEDYSCCLYPGDEGIENWCDCDGNVLDCCEECGGSAFDGSDDCDDDCGICNGECFAGMPFCNCTDCEGVPFGGGIEFLGVCYPGDTEIFDIYYQGIFGNMSDLIPIFVGLTNLKVLKIGGNYFPGELPAEFYQMTQLEELWADSCRIQGQISEEFCTMTNLNWIGLSYNELTGQMPACICDLEPWSGFIMTGNAICPPYPECGLNIEWNNGTDFQDCGCEALGYPWYQIYNECLNAETTTAITMFQHNLSDDIPYNICQFQALEYLGLHSNSIRGTIPGCLFTLPVLKDIRLNDNMLDGSIPASVCEGGLALPGAGLYLDDNGLSGTIPDEIGDCTLIDTIKLYNNNLSGEIPESLGNLTSLTKLRLDNNELSGEVPDELCDLSSMNFSSTINWNVSENQLCPPYPQCIEDYMGEQNTSEC